MKIFIKNMLGLIPDSMYLKYRYRYYTKKKLNLKNPQTFNEKLQWLKLHNRKPEYTIMADKVEAKDYISKVLGEEFVIPTLGVWDRAEDVDFDLLPDKFVIKCNHNSGLGMYVCTDKTKMDAEKVRRGLKLGLRQDYYACDREWPYKNIKRKIIAEKFLDDRSGHGLIDYKVFNFGGEPKLIQVDFDRFTGHKKNLYNTNWELCDFEFNYPSHPEVDIPKPKQLDKIIEASKILSKGHPYLRTDFYVVDDNVYVGEITFFPASGYGKFTPEEYDRVFGDMIKLNL